MDFNKAIRELYEQKKSLDRAIARLESRLAAMSEMRQRSTRGRKSMSTEERLRVSARMTAYWAARRAQGTKPANEGVEESELPAPADPEPENGASGISV
jgi:hypothetical protein